MARIALILKPERGCSSSIEWMTRPPKAPKHGALKKPSRMSDCSHLIDIGGTSFMVRRRPDLGRGADGAQLLSAAVEGRQRVLRSVRHRSHGGCLCACLAGHAGRRGAKARQRLSFWYNPPLVKSGSATFSATTVSEIPYNPLDAPVAQLDRAPDYGSGG